MVKRGKNYRDLFEEIKASDSYLPEAAVSLAKKTAKAAFDETVEVHIRTRADTRHADQLLRGVALLPHGLGKQIKVLVFAEGEAATIAEQSGADYVGAEDIAKKIEDGWVDFDLAIATRDMMGKIGKLGRVLGKRGLMPNPKTGTVVQEAQDIPQAIEDARKGRVEYRMDRTGIIHAPLGKISFEVNALMENMSTLMSEVSKNRPSGVKGQFVKSIVLATTMGPGIPVDVTAALSLEVD